MKLKTKPLSDRALEVLSRVTCEKWIAKLPPGQLDRALYVEVNAALEALGGKWARKVQGHVFDFDPAEAIEAIVTAGCWTDVKRSLDQFYTPPELAEAIVSRAGVRGEHVLEPSAGRGSLAIECIRQGALSVQCIDVDRASLERLPMTMELHTRHGDFMAMEPYPDGWGRNGERLERYSRIVMNPPFSRGQDVAHVVRAFSRWLAPAGRLVAIMGAGVTFRRGGAYDAFRALVDANGRIEPLPDGSFVESGTNVRAVVVELTAPGVAPSRGVG